MEPPPPPSQEAIGYWMSLITSKTIMLVAIVEVLTGLSLVFNKYGALMSLILMSVAVNAVLYHIAYDPDAIGMGAALLVLNILMLYNYRDKYKDLLAR